jgi:hypothetical protein
MRTLIEILAGLAILANAVIYGTDVFGAIIQRSAIAAVDDRNLTQVMGHIHRDRALGEHRSRSPRRARPDHLRGDLHPRQQASEHGADRSGSRRPSAGQRP